MPKKTKRVSKTGKPLGRPRVYANPKEKFTVYNKKKPSVRLTAKEKKLIMYAREKPEAFQKWLAEVEMGF